MQIGLEIMENVGKGSGAVLNLFITVHFQGCEFDFLLTLLVKV